MFNKFLIFHTPYNILILIRNKQGVNMVDNKVEIESLFKKMLKETEENAPKDALYQEDIKTTGTLKVHVSY